MDYFVLRVVVPGLPSSYSTHYTPRGALSYSADKWNKV